jgi:HD-like signal output (HDOD) protein
VNSAQFGLANEVTDTADAVIILGVERIKSLILLAGVFSQYSGIDCPGFSPDPIWNHSLEVAMMVRTIVFSETKNATAAETAFTAGLLHDVGKLILAANLPKVHEAVRQLQLSKKATHLGAETMVMGTTHAEFAACLLATWRLPLAVLEAIAWHHTPQRCTDYGFSLPAAVHVANSFAHEGAGRAAGETATELLNFEFLQKNGLADNLKHWREICGLPPVPKEPHQ